MKMQTVELVPCQGINSSHDIGRWIIVSRHVQVQTPVDELGSIADSYRSIWSVDTCAGVLVKELSERFQRTQYTDARTSRDGRLPACCKIQGVAFVHAASQRFEDIDWIRCILRDCDLVDVGLRSAARGLKVGISRMKFPRDEVVGEQCVLCTVDGLLDDI